MKRWTLASRGVAQGAPILLGLMVATAVVATAARPEGGPAARAHGSRAGGGVGVAAFVAPRLTGQEAGVTFAATVDREAVLVGGDGLVQVELVATGERPPLGRPDVPTDLVVVLDRSGSMAGEKIVFAHQAVRSLIDQMGEADRFALVTYDNVAEQLIAMAPATPADKARWHRIVGTATPRGGTAISAGIEEGARILRETRLRDSTRTSRVILISDGLPTNGDVTPEGLRGRAGSIAAAGGVLSAVGVGRDFDYAMMSGLADAGTGNYYYLEDGSDMGRVFVAEFAGAKTTIASNLTIRATLGDGVHIVEAAGYPVSRSGSRAEISPGSLYAGQERRIWLTLSVPNRVEGRQALGEFSLAFVRDAQAHTITLTESPQVAVVADEQQYFAGIDANMWTSGVTSEAFNALRTGIAADVRDGNLDAARHRIGAYRAQVGALNSHVQSAAVSQQLSDLERLEQEAEANSATAEGRSDFSRSTAYESQTGRRRGSNPIY